MSPKPLQTITELHDVAVAAAVDALAGVRGAEEGQGAAQVRDIVCGQGNAALGDPTELAGVVFKAELEVVFTAGGVVCGEAYFDGGDALVGAFALHHCQFPFEHLCFPLLEDVGVGAWWRDLHCLAVASESHFQLEVKGILFLGRGTGTKRGAKCYKLGAKLAFVAGDFLVERIDGVEVYVHADAVFDLLKGQCGGWGAGAYGGAIVH